MSYTIETVIILTCDWCAYTLTGDSKSNLTRGTGGWEMRYDEKPKTDLCPDCVETYKAVVKEQDTQERIREHQQQFDVLYRKLHERAYAEAKRRCGKV